MQAVIYIGNKLKWARMSNALTQAQLAERAGVTIATVARIERDEVEPHMTTVRKLSDALGVEPRELVED